MTKIYWITGVIGAGKSTLGLLLAKQLPDTDFIDGDYFILGVDALSFEERVTLIKQRLIEKCQENALKGRSAVIAYPVWKETVTELRGKLNKMNAELIVVGIELPPQSRNREYTEWEIKRRNEMNDCNGVGYADIIIQHPSNNPQDSLDLLIDKIKKF
jgi:adenylate kinase family enzyme